MAIILPQLNQPNMLLNHILDRPELVDNIRNLEPGVLNMLIHRSQADWCDQTIFKATHCHEA